MINHDTAVARWRRRATCAFASTAMIAGGAVALAGPALADATTVYVSLEGNDHSGCGTSQANQCASIQYGVDQAAAGDTVQVAPGSYRGAVTITKSLTLQGAGADTTAIDGYQAPAGANGLVAISQPGGDVTVSGFTITNPALGTGYSPYSLTIGDSSASDTITVSDNKFPGDPASPSDAAAAPLGVDSADTAATQVITDNEFSGLWQAVLVEGSRGPVSVADNVFHDLISTSDGDGGSYPATGVYILSDKQVTVADQDVTGNTFRNYGGIGIAYNAGYSQGGCTAPTVCQGTVSGSITGNTFQLDANQTSYPAAALRLRAVNPTDVLNLTVGNNTGVVTAPTQPIFEQPRDGAINITPTATPNTITTDPAATISINAPTAITTAEAPVTFTGSALNNSGDDIAHARYDLRITGTSGITAAQLKLEYSTDGGTTFLAVPLTGTATAGSAITGYFGPVGGFPFPSSATPLQTVFRLSVPDATAPSGALNSTVSLDEVSTGTGNPAVNTLASDSSVTTVTRNTAPVASNLKVSTIVDTPVSFTLPASDADDDALTYTHFKVDNGTLTGTGADLTFTPAAGFTGTTSFAYSVTDGKAGSDTGTVTITVAAKAVTTLALAVSPAKPTTANVVTVNATVTSASGPINGGTVSLTVGGRSYSGTVVNGRVAIATTKLVGGTFPISATYSGTATAAGSSATASVTVTKVASALTLTANPTKTTTKTASTAINVVVASSGVSSDGGRITVAEGSRALGFTATVVNGKATITLPKLSAGKRTFTLTYAGNASVAGSTKAITITVTTA